MYVYSRLLDWKMCKIMGELFRVIEFGAATQTSMIYRKSTKIDNFPTEVKVLADYIKDFLKSLTFQQNKLVTHGTLLLQ